VPDLRRGHEGSEEQAFAACLRERGTVLLRFARRLIPDAGDAQARLDAVLAILPPRQRVTVVLRARRGADSAGR
jgi:DNA-directed RNA polymerase specialized sigma24 family protein